MSARRIGLRQAAIVLVVLGVVIVGAILPAAALAVSPGSISGHRTMPNNAADFYSNVLIYSVSGSNLTPVTGWAEVNNSITGTYTVTGLIPGTYRVGEPAFAQGAVAYAAAFFSGAISPAAGNDVVVYSATNTSGIDLHRTTSDTIAADTAEPDNTPKQAATLVPGAAWLDRTLFGKPDSDWFKFNAVKDHWYAIETSGTATHPLWGSVDVWLSDTYVHLFDSDGQTRLAYDDDAFNRGFYSTLRWKALSTGMLYARVTSYSEANGGTADAGAYAVHLVDEGADSYATTVRVSVVDSSTGVGIPHARVELTWSNVDLYRFADANGSVSFSGIPAQDYYVKAWAVGHVSSDATRTTVTSGVTDNLTVRESTPAAPALGAVNGSVQLAEGGAAVGATVSLVGPGVIQTYTPEATGHFYFANLPLGVYTVTISQPGYRTIIESGLVVGAWNSDLPSETLIDVLLPAGTVKGTVTSAGVGLGGVSVVAGEVSAMTGSDGSYVLPGVEPGSAQLTFTKPTYDPVVLPVTVSQGATSTLDATLVRTQCSCTITRSPNKTTLSYRRKKGKAKFTLSATLSAPYGKLPGSLVYLQYSANGKTKWKRLATLTTNSKGVAAQAFTVKKKSTKYYRWYTPTNSVHTASYSKAQKVSVR